jgi:hypothetical protein
MVVRLTLARAGRPIPRQSGASLLLLFPVPVQPTARVGVGSCPGHHVPGQLGLPYQGSTRTSAGDLVPLRESPFIFRRG